MQKMRSKCFDIPHEHIEQMIGIIMHFETIIVRMNLKLIVA